MPADSIKYCLSNSTFALLTASTSLQLSSRQYRTHYDEQDFYQHIVTSHLYMRVVYILKTRKWLLIHRLPFLVSDYPPLCFNAIALETL